jgi:hypothetical protein
LLQTIDLVAKRLNDRLKLSGVVYCMYESGTRLAAEVSRDVDEFFSDTRQPHTPWADARTFQTRIRRNIRLAEAPSFGQSIFHYAPGSNGGADYEYLAREGAAGSCIWIQPRAPALPWVSCKYRATTAIDTVIPIGIPTAIPTGKRVSASRRGAARRTARPVMRALRWVHDVSLSPAARPSELFPLEFQVPRKRVRATARPRANWPRRRPTRGAPWRRPLRHGSRAAARL